MRKVKALGFYILAVSIIMAIYGGSCMKKKCLNPKVSESTIDEQGSIIHDERSEINDMISYLAVCMGEYVQLRCNGDPPRIDWNELFPNLQGYCYDVDKYDLAIKMTVKDARYDVVDGNYRIRIILNYIASEAIQQKYSVVQICDGLAYWKDNYASDGQGIDDLDWSRVDFLYGDYRVGADGLFISNSPTKLPSYVE